VAKGKTSICTGREGAQIDILLVFLISLTRADRVYGRSKRMMPQYILGLFLSMISVSMGIVDIVRAYPKEM